MNKGWFFSLDGIDGGGKSTQLALLAAWLRGAQPQEVVVCVDPGGTHLGQELRQVLLASRHQMDPPCEALLFMASRAQLVAEVIRPALARGAIVLSDRYVLANLVYQGYAGGLDVELLRQAGRISTAGLEPDCTFVLDLPLDLALTRRDRPADRMEQRPREYHERVRQGFLTEAARAKDRIRVVDASQGVAVVQQQLQREVAALLSLAAP